MEKLKTFNLCNQSIDRHTYKTVRMVGKNQNREEGVSDVSLTFPIGKGKAISNGFV